MSDAEDESDADLEEIVAESQPRSKRRPPEAEEKPPAQKKSVVLCLGAASTMGMVGNFANIFF
jgi:hypothetical protein